METDMTAEPTGSTLSQPELVIRTFVAALRRLTRSRTIARG
jgi:hypothetical protein